MSLGDLLIAVGGFGFAIATWPGIIENFRRRRGYNLTMCSASVLMIASITVGLFLLGAMFSFTAALAQIVGWVVLTVQAVIYRRNI